MSGARLLLVAIFFLAANKALLAADPEKLPLWNMNADMADW